MKFKNETFQVDPNSLVNVPSTSSLPASPQSTASITAAQRPIPNQKQAEDLVTDAENGVFSDVVFTFDGKEKNYSPIYNWFSSTRDFERRPDGNVRFTCIICRTILRVPLGKPGNLIKHGVGKHADFKLWYQRYEATKTSSNSFKLDEKNLIFIKFFLTSSIALEAINNPYLRKCLSFKVPSAKTFKNVYLPNVFNTLQEAINERLRVARSITLIADIWTSKTNNDFLGLAGMLVYANARKEPVVLGMERMPGKHNAENIKSAIESVISNYTFNTSKITAVVTDEGSNFLCLFKQLDNGNSLFIESDSAHEETNEEDEAENIEENSEANGGAEDDENDEHDQHDEFTTHLYDNEAETNLDFVDLASVKPMGLTCGFQLWV